MLFVGGEFFRARGRRLRGGGLSLDEVIYDINQTNRKNWNTSEDED